MPQAISDFYKNYLVRINAIDAEEQELLSSNTKKGWTQHLLRKSSLIREYHAEVDRDIHAMILPYISGERETSDEEAEALKEGALRYFHSSLFDEVMESSVLRMLTGRYARKGNRFEERKCRFAFANNAYLSSEGTFGEQSMAEAERVMEGMNRIREIRKEHASEETFLQDVDFIIHTGYRLFDRECRQLEPDLTKLVKHYNTLSKIEQYRDILPEDYFESCMREIREKIGVHVMFMQALHWEKVPKKHRAALSKVFEHELSKELELPEGERHAKLFMTYVFYCFYAGRLSADECFNLLYPFSKALPSDVDFTRVGWYDITGNDRFFAVCMTTRPLLQMIMASRLPKEGKRRQVAEVLYDVKKYIETIPRECAGRENMDYCLYHLLYDVIEFIDDEAMAIEFIDTLMMNRQLATLIHTIMTAKLTQAIMDPLVDERPELFYRVLGVSSNEEVRAHKEDLALFLYNAARCHDIGKIRIATIINTQIRSISDTEFSLIRKHSEWSALILSRNAKLSAYCEIALGHHKSYDGKQGYPDEYDNRSSRYRILTDILSICDSMDAATDAYGRNYTRGKTFEKVFAEFESLKGTRYNPEVIDFIRGNDELFAQLKEITSKEARGDFYYHIYRKYR
ncbi:MAG: HD domain-containing protein [Lachnospiraceae bacterium]|nr:HD domain-containing protein [Lachnospiraceae bacterium]